MFQKQKEAAPQNVQMPNEPSYQGKTLGEWLKMRHDGWELSTNAVDALRQMGTNVFPALLASLTYKDPVFNLYDYDVSMEAVGAFISLREQAKTALPTLSELMDGDDQDLVFRAMLVSLGTGADAVPCLMKGLTNRFPDVRNEAANYLTGEWSAQFPEQRKLAIPVLVKFLNDPDQSVRMNATNQLKELDPQTAAKAGIQ